MPVRVDREVSTAMGKDLSRANRTLAATGPAESALDNDVVRSPGKARMLTDLWCRASNWATGSHLRLALLRYAGTALIVVGLSFLLPVDTLRDSRIVIPFLVVVACAWYAGAGPGILGLFLVVICFKYRQNGIPACFAFGRRELSTLGPLAVVMASVGWAGKARRHSQAIARNQAIELKDLHRRKDEFLATLAHELRNPLAPLRSGLDALRLIRQQHGPTADVDEIHVMMQRQLDQLVRLIDDLLEVSRINTGRIELHRERVSISDLIRDAVDTSRPHIAAARHELTVNVQEPPVVICADRARLTQVLTNLLNNAAKFTPPGGDIALSASSDGERVTIAVRDTGIGLSKDMLPRVFDMFTQIANPLTRPHGGLGIGLSLARTIVEMHGGTITAFSEGPGKGSAFVLTVPLVAAEQQEQMHSADSAPPPAPRSSSRRVLIVDDNIDAAQSLGMLLSAGGHECHLASGGEEALEVAGRLDPEIFLLDVGMPGMNGYELARRLRAIPQFRLALLVAVTGWGKEEDRQKSLAAGFDEHLVKPVSASALGELLARARESGSKAG